MGESRGPFGQLRAIAGERDALLLEVDAADFLKLSIRTLQTWRCAGRGPAFVRAGRAVRYRRGDLVEWIDARVVRPQGRHGTGATAPAAAVP